MAYGAVILADSTSPLGARITTMQVSYPRFVHAEELRHRMFSRSVSSNRALTTAQVVQGLLDDPVLPIRWGTRSRSMEQGAVLDTMRAARAEFWWLRAMRRNIRTANKLATLGVHKSITNRLLETWQWVHVVITATDWANFFELRCAPDAQPEIQHLALLMRDVYATSIPAPLDYGHWHLPYITTFERAMYNLHVLRQLAIARCARASYLGTDLTRPTHEDIELFDRLTASKHYGPYEHVARPTETAHAYYDNFRGFRSYRHIFMADVRG